MKNTLRRTSLRGTLALSGTLLFLTAAARAQTETAPPAPQAAMIPAGTPVVVSLTDRLKSGQVRAGSPVRYTVAQDVIVGGVTLIPAGTPALGAVETSRGAGAFGRAGRLRVTCDAVVLPSGLRVPLREQESATVMGHSSADTAGLAAVAVGLAVGSVTYSAADVGTNLFNNHPNRTAPTLAGLGAGLLSGLLVGSLFHGGDVTLAPGRRLELAVARDTPLTGALSPTPASPPSSAQ